MYYEMKWRNLADEKPPEDGKYLCWVYGIKDGFPVIARYEDGKLWWWGVHGQVILQKSEYKYVVWTEVPTPKEG